MAGTGSAVRHVFWELKSSVHECIAFRHSEHNSAENWPLPCFTIWSECETFPAVAHERGVCVYTLVFTVVVSYGLDPEEFSAEMLSIQ